MVFKEMTYFIVDFRATYTLWRSINAVLAAYLLGWQPTVADSPLDRRTAPTVTLDTATVTGVAIMLSQ